MSSCYCRRCRKAHSSPVGTIVIVKRSDFAYITGQELVTPFQFSPRVNRPSARDVVLAFPLSRRSSFGIPAGLLDDDPGLRNVKHIFVGSRAPWRDIHDDAPQHAEWPPDSDLESRFQGSHSFSSAEAHG